MVETLVGVACGLILGVVGTMFWVVWYLGGRYR